MAAPAIWDYAAECGDPAGEAVEIAARLPAQLAFVQATSPFYRDLWEGVDVDGIRTVEDLQRLPFTEKDDLRRSQEAAPPLGGTQGAPLERIARIQCTGGTTGVPMRIGFTKSDLAWLDDRSEEHTSELQSH